MKQLNTHLESKLSEQVSDLLHYYFTYKERKREDKSRLLFSRYLGKETFHGVGRADQNVEHRRSNASAASAVTYTRRNPTLRAAREEEDVAGIETGAGILQREMGVS